jgi:hypothetical protein
MADE